MTSDEVIRMAQEAGLFDDDQEPLPEAIERFADLVRADERAVTRAFRHKPQETAMEIKRVSDDCLAAWIIVFDAVNGENGDSVEVSENELHEVCSALRELQSLRAEVERLRKDAERYRWVRVNGYAIDMDSIWLVCPTVSSVDTYIDAAIDKARGE